MSQAKILVVDDDKNIRRTVSMALESLDYFVHTAFDGKDAMVQLTNDRYDLIITDLKMPGMNGMELLQEAISKYPEIKIVLISAHGTVDNAVEAMKLGAVDFLQKPFTPKELRNLVHNVLETEDSVESASEYKSSLKSAKNSARQRDFNNAVAQAKKAIGSDPSKPEAFDFLGRLQETLGDFDSAIKNYRVAISLDPTYKPAKNNLDRATRNSDSARPSL
ncbi:response regulator [Pleurocapsa sp. PCC 7319]|uniref:response regulator n=1 Tax=Pleurocapsa sp. PCC 7319 TaxID=118161 RepID=UPI000347B64D|nr:response regulator [Pleurocapsa sp. PCC 7319]